MISKPFQILGNWNSRRISKVFFWSLEQFFLTVGQNNLLLLTKYHFLHNFKSLKLCAKKPLNVLDQFPLQATRKSCWQPEMSGWIEATMQQIPSLHSNFHAPAISQDMYFFINLGSIQNILWHFRVTWYFLLISLILWS